MCKSVLVVAIYALPLSLLILGCVFILHDRHFMYRILNLVQIIGGPFRSKYARTFSPPNTAAVNGSLYIYIYNERKPQ